MQYLINGELSNTIAANDRGLQYGDGLFETIAYRHHQLEWWPQHLARMRQGCERLRLIMPDEQIWLQDIKHLSLSGNAVIKLILTRGGGGRGYRYTDHQPTTRLVSQHDWPDYPAHWQQGVHIRFCQTPVSVNPVLAGMKHLNRLDNVLARNEWQDVQIAEGLMCEDNQRVIEGTMSNVFAVKQGQLLTPSLTRAGVRGVMREQVISQARSQGVAVIECDISKHELLDMDELFLSNCMIGIWPVIQLEQKKWVVGKLTRMLQTAFNQAP